MLDQNTDRMWFVIGAVIVGAAIIFIANGALPEIFASVADSFEEVSDNATSEIIWNTSNMMHLNNILYGKHPNNNNDLTPTYTPSYASNKAYATSDYIEVEPGEQYTFTALVDNPTNDKRIIFYDHNRENIYSVAYRGPSHAVQAVAPNNAKYIRVSTRYIDTENEYGRGASVEHWWLGKSSIYDEYNTDG